MELEDMPNGRVTPYMTHASSRDAQRADPDTDTAGRLQPTLPRRDGRAGTASSPQLQTDPFAIGDDYGPDGVAAIAEAAHLSGTTGRRESEARDSESDLAMDNKARVG